MIKCIRYLSLYLALVGFTALANSDAPVTAEPEELECEDNEFYSDCANCKGTCSFPYIDNSTCICAPGCTCIDGYLRDYDGKCVPQEKCEPPCDGDMGQIYDPCGPSCERTCENYNDTKWVCTPDCIPGGGCKCLDGLVRNSGGQCVSPSDCSNVCPPNEAFSLCKANFCENTCQDPNKRVKCPYRYCKSGCVCVYDFVRDDNGVCITQNTCFESCGGDPNAREYSCTPCNPATCTSLNDESIMCAAVCDGKTGCQCKEGYAEHEGKCIPIKDCPTCGENEAYLCRKCDLRCDDIDEKCLDKTDCTPGCYCKLGYARNCDGICVKLSECNQEGCGGDPNAYFDQCGLNCDRSCDNLRNLPFCYEDLCTIRGKCRCKEGYVLNDSGKCVDPEDCYCSKRSSNLHEVCGKNEIYDHYPLDCDPINLSCEMYFKGIQRDCRPGCFTKPRCRCMEGFVKNSQGECVTPHDCCDDPNSELIAGPNVCPGGTCQCPHFLHCNEPWVPFGCQCKFGHVKVSDTNSTCVPLSECYKYR